MAFDTVYYINLQGIDDTSKLRDLLKAMVIERARARPRVYFIACRDAVAKYFIFIQIMWLISSGFLLVRWGWGSIGWFFGVTTALTVVTLVDGRSKLHVLIDEWHDEGKKSGQEWNFRNSRISSVRERIRELANDKRKRSESLSLRRNGK